MSEVRHWVYMHVQRNQSHEGVKLKSIWAAPYCPVEYEAIRAIVRDLTNEGYLLSVGWGRYRTNPDKKGMPPLQRDPRFRKSSAVADAKMTPPRYKEQDHVIAQSAIALPVIRPIDEGDEDGTE